MTKLALVAGPVAGLWLVVATLFYLLLWGTARERIKPPSIPVILALASLAALPAAALVKFLVPSRVLFRHVTSSPDHRLLLAMGGIALVWLAMVGLTCLVVGLAGRTRVRPSPPILALTIIVLASLPALVLASWWSDNLRAAVVTPLLARKATLALVPVGILAVAGLGLLVSTVRIVGWRTIARNRLAAAVLVAGVLAVPALGIADLGLRWKDRVLARANLITTKSPPVILPPGCGVFPPGNAWNTPVRHLPVDRRSADYIASIGPARPLHPDFGIVTGIPYAVADATTPTVTVDGSGGGSTAYRIPDDATVEGGGRGDAHVLVVDPSACRLYELYKARRVRSQHWEVEAADTFDLRTHALSRGPSVDAAGLPIFPGLVRYEEVERGVIPHALRFTAHRTRAAFVWPARHFASSSTDERLPPMGQRFRLRASFDVSGFSREVRAILVALQDYGMFLADNGGDWYLTGAPDARWNPARLAELARVTGNDFEAVDTSSTMIDRGSGEARVRR